MGPITFQILDRAAFHSAIELLRDAHKHRRRGLPGRTAVHAPTPPATSTARRSNPQPRPVGRTYPQPEVRPTPAAPGAAGCCHDHLDADQPAPADKPSTIIGAAEDPEHAQRQLIAATPAADRARRRRRAPPLHAAHRRPARRDRANRRRRPRPARPCRGSPTARADCSHTRIPFGANHLTAAAAHLPLAAPLCGRRPACGVFRGPVCALARGIARLAAGIGLGAHSPFNRSAGRPV